MPHRRDGRPHLLFLAFYFPPTRASGVFRALAIANHFADAGWDVTVVTPQREFFTEAIRSVDESLERQIHPDVDVQRVYFPGRPWRTDIRSFGWFRGNFPSLANDWLGRLETSVFPERYAPWIPRVLKAGAALHRGKPVDVIMATGNPYSSFAAAWGLGKLIRRPYVLDYRDSWTLDQFAERPKYEPDDPVWPWERRLVGAAARTVFVNETQREWHADRYPDAAERMLVVENGFEPSALADLPEDMRPPQDRALQLGYIGTITQQLPLAEFLAGWELAKDEPELADAQVRMYGHLGFFPNQTGRILSLLPVAEPEMRVSYEGPVEKGGIAGAYASLDILLMIIPSSRYVTAGKVYEYMATGKPIVTVHEPWTGARRPLEGYPLAFTVDDLESETLRDALVAAARATRQLEPEAVRKAREHAARYTRSAQLEPLECELRRLAHG